MRLARHVHLALLGCLALLAAACAPLIAGYSLEAYRNATSLKAETLAIIAHADEPYAQHAEEVRDLRIRLSAAHEFAAGMPRNALSAGQWQIMIDPARSLAGGFLARWERDTRLNPVFVGEQSAQIARAFDDIICLEANKGQDTACQN
jgi:hypothetical protein